MDPGVRSPLVDFFRRGEVARDVRLLAARGAFAPRALEQLAILLVLVDDGDQEVAAAARATVDALPRDPLALFLGRTEVPGAIRDFFAARGVAPVAGGAAGDDAPLIEIPEAEAQVADGEVAPEGGETPPDGEVPAEGEPAKMGGALARLVSMTVMQKIKVAMRGTREERAVLIRDSNRLVAAAVLSSPKLSENEVEGIARMANVGEEVLRVIASNRAWMKSYTIASGLTRNPKTPIALSMHLLQRLSDRDIKMLVTDRNVPEPVRLAARKRVAESRKQ